MVSILLVLSDNPESEQNTLVSMCSSCRAEDSMLCKVFVRRLSSTVRSWRVARDVPVRIFSFTVRSSSGTRETST